MATSNDILVYAEQENGQPKKGALEITTKAKALADSLGGSVIAVTLGPGAAQAAGILGGYGAKTVFVSEDQAYGNFSIGPAVSALASVIGDKQPKLMLASASTVGKDVAARIAARCDSGIIANALNASILEGAVHVMTAIFGGSMNVTKQFSGAGTNVVVLRPNAVAPEMIGGAASVEQLSAPIPAEAMLAKIIEKVVEGTGQMPIEEASVIVAGGRGVASVDGFAIIQDLATAFSGVVGASRPAVDEHWIAYSQQIGQTGKTVKPQLYIACGISGAIQHKVGMQGSSYIVAINKNPEAPIFQFADCNIVGDLFEIVPELAKEVKKRKQG